MATQTGTELATLVLLSFDARHSGAHRLNSYIVNYIDKTLYSSGPKTPSTVQCRFRSLALKVACFEHIEDTYSKPCQCPHAT